MTALLSAAAPTASSPTRPAHGDDRLLLRIDLRCHRLLRGPYTGGSELLRQIVPELAARRDLLSRCATTITAIAPDLGGLPPGPQTLTDLAQGEERTRYYSAERTRDLAYAVSELVRAWSEQHVDRLLHLHFWDVAEADPTDVELIAMLRRRWAGAFGTLDEHLEGPDEQVPAHADRAQHFLDSDGTSELPEARTGYDGLLEDDRQARHTARAKALQDVPGAARGAVLYHLERGESSASLAPAALMASLEQFFAAGFYAAGLDVARRGRLITAVGDPWWQKFTQREIGALTYLDDCESALALIRETRRATTDISAQMRCAYMTAMLYTRHLPKHLQDQEIALEWSNVAIALADGNPDPARRGFFGAFMRNGRALVELHRGDLDASLALVEEAMGVADGSLDTEAHQLHRSVLVYNKARILFGLGDLPAALHHFTEVVGRDPDYEGTYFDRAAVHRVLGDLDAALADLETAIALSVAFPEAHYNCADIFIERGDAEQALRHLDIALDVAPDHVDALVNRAALLLAEGDLEQAQVDIRHGLDLAPDSANLWSADGLLKSQIGDRAGALASLTTAITLDPTLVDALVNRAVLQFGQGLVSEAVGDLDAAIAYDDGPVLRTNRGLGLHALGDDPAAVDDFDAALLMTDADVAGVLFLRGRSRLALGDLGGAEADFKLHEDAWRDAGEPSPHADELVALRAGRSVVPAGETS